jgi:formamidopyrimidine-DNA glycosylase
MIQNVSRRGKYIIFTLKTEIMLIHLRMSGRLILDRSKKQAPHERVRFILGDGRFLKFEDQRKFGRISLLKDPEEKLSKLGVEPLSPEFTLAYFKKLLTNKKTKIKAVLLNQNILAGLGNIYADETLWEAKIHPERRANTLSDEEIKSLHQAIRKILKLAIEFKGTSLGNTRANFHSSTGKRGGNKSNLSVYKRQNQPCLRCGTQIIKIVSSQRGTHFCPVCQLYFS